MPESVKVKIKTLSPVHIGSGEKISPSEYFYDNQYYYRLSMDRLISSLNKEQLEKFIELSARGLSVSEVIDEKTLEKFVDYKLPLHESAKNYLKRKHRIQVNLEIKTAGKAYIPGSSIKGSILSGVYYYLIKEKADKNLKNMIERREKFYDIQDELFKLLGGKNRFFHWLDVSDSDLKKLEYSLELAHIRVADRKGKEIRGGIPILVEVIKEGVEFEFKMKQPSEDSPDIKDILKNADGFYREIAKKEGKNNLPREGYILRIGHGSGVLSTSFLLSAEKSGIKNYQVPRPQKNLKPLRPGDMPSTRRFINDSNLGWIRIDFLNNSSLVSKE